MSEGAGVSDEMEEMDEMQLMEIKEVIAPDGYLAMAANIRTTVEREGESPLTFVQERAVALSLCQDERSIFVTLSAASAIQLGHDILRQGAQAANALDSEELETVELDMSFGRSSAE